MSHDSADLTSRLQERIGPRPWRMWFEHASVELDAGRLIVKTGSKFEADWIARRFRDDLDGLASELDVERGHIEVRPGDAHGSAEPPDAPRPAAPARPNRMRLHELEDMVVGQSNRLAWTAAMGLADDEQADHLSPLFIHGGCGVGKTHLLQGICRRVRDRGAGGVRYMTGEQFTNEFIQAVRHNQLERFRRSMRSLQLLAIDDVHFVAGKDKTQNEILHTLDAIALGGARLALASDAHPSTIKRFNAALVSRFTSGMLVSVDPPDAPLRREVADRIARRRSMLIEPSALDVVVELCPENMRQIQGLMARLEALHLMSRRDTPITAGQVHEAVSHATGALQRPLTLAMITSAACTVLSVSESELMGPGRSARTVLARSVAASIARDATSASFPEIARALGRKAHSSVHAAVERIRGDQEAGRTVTIDGRQRSLDQLKDQILVTARSH